MVLSAEDDANLAKMLYTHVCGSPVEFPSWDEIDKLCLTVLDKGGYEDIDDIVEDEHVYDLLVPLEDFDHTHGYQVADWLASAFIAATNTV